MNLYIIRHGKTRESWDTLSYGRLLALVKLEDDPDPDMEYLEANLDEKKAIALRINKIYTSPLKRALKTAEYIASFTGSEVIKAEELEEIRFEDIPKSVYDGGAEAIRKYLVKESLKASRKFDFSMFDEGSMLLTHGFLMRHLYAQIFNMDVSSLATSPLFTNYLSGFCTKDGRGLSLLRQKA
ncbi:MAG: histidine phosphatase family protein [Candidatus Micrarchaeaceae archaeon]